MMEKSWVVQVDDEAKKLPQLLKDEKNAWEKHSIYKLPASVTALNDKAYKPRVISFGPYHHGDANLKPMEPHKHRALLHFLRRSGESMQCCLDVLDGVAGDLMDAHDCLDPKWREDREGFLKMMITDGCFLLEILRAPSFRCDYACNDPIFSDHGELYVVPFIKRDMLMLENQLPMLLPIKLLSVQDQESQEDNLDDSINTFIARFCFPSITSKLNLGKQKHVLDVYRQVLLVGDAEGHARARARARARAGVGARIGQLLNRLHSSSIENVIPSATQLCDAGISIRRSGSTNIRDTCFKPGLFRGVLYLPSIVVDDLTESVFLNLIAFERSHVGIGNDVTSYVAFMDDIIDNARDVTLLRSRSTKVVESAYGSDKAVADMFNSLSRDVPLDPGSKFSHVQTDAKLFYARPLNRWWGILFHTYFTSPWSVISLIAAIFLFGLTIVQTVFTVKQSYQKPN